MKILLAKILSFLLNILVDFPMLEKLLRLDLKIVFFKYQVGKISQLVWD